jgi:hypothetical protein
MPLLARLYAPPSLSLNMSVSPERMSVPAPIVCDETIGLTVSSA